MPICCWILRMHQSQTICIWVVEKGKKKMGCTLIQISVFRSSFHHRESLLFTSRKLICLKWHLGLRNVLFGSGFLLGLFNLNQFPGFLRSGSAGKESAKAEAGADKGENFDIRAKLCWLMKITELWCEALPESEAKQREGRHENSWADFDTENLYNWFNNKNNFGFEFYTSFGFFFLSFTQFCQTWIGLFITF